MQDDDPEEFELGSSELSPVICWRCGLEAHGDADVCPHCAARLRSPTAGAAGTPVSQGWVGDSLQILFVTYGLLLVSTLIFAGVLHATVDKRAGKAALRKQIFNEMLFFEGADTAIIVAALVMARRHYAAERWQPRQGVRIAAWLLALPLLAGMLALNVGYHYLLRNWLHIPLISDDLMRHFDWMALVAICVQPAIIEEAYCRWFALDTLSGVVNMHGAVWISAVLFGFLHVAVLPSVPYLILMGAVLGYLRCASGTLLLPILIHFAHNLAVLTFESFLR